MADITVHEAEHGGHDSAAHNENLKFAMWLYLTSEVVIFSMLIAGYAIFRATQGSSVNLVKDALGIALVTANTFVLLVSSYAMVMGLRAIRMGNRQGFYVWILITAILGSVFLGGQYIEYSELGHLGVSLDKQDFTVATNIFETVNHVEAEIDGAQLYTYNEAYLNEDGEVVEGQDPFVVVTELFEMEDIREFLFVDTLEEIPAELSNTVVILPATVTLDSDSYNAIDNIAERNLTLVVGDISKYHVDFVDDAELFNDVDWTVLNATRDTINPETRLKYEQLLIDWDSDFILLNATGEAVTESNNIETARHEIDNNLESLDIRQIDRVPLNSVAVQTIDNEIVPFTAIIAGTAVDLDQDQYDNLNAYFRALIGNDASGYGMRFYAPTAFHGAHVFIGVLWALFVLWRGRQGAYDKNAIGLELFGLYWHFVDVVWIVLFTLIYLV